MAMGRSRQAGGNREEDLRDALFRLEPDVRFLDGVVMALRILGETQEPIEPVALAALARCGIVAIGEVKTGLRHAMEAAGIDTT
jgi:hypothetical protein